MKQSSEIHRDLRFLHLEELDTRPPSSASQAGSWEVLLGPPWGHLGATLGSWGLAYHQGTSPATATWWRSYWRWKPRPDGDFVGIHWGNLGHTSWEVSDAKSGNMLHQWCAWFHNFSLRHSHFFCFRVAEFADTAWIVRQLGESRNSSGKSASTWVVGLGEVCGPAQMIVSIDRSRLVEM